MGELIQARTLVAIDPGAAHCGYARFKLTGLGWVCHKVGVASPGVFLEYLDLLFQQEPPDLVVCEEYRQYPDSPAWDTLGTVEAIGVIKWLAHKAHIPVEMQQAAIKRQAAGLMRARGASLKRADVRGGLQVHSQDAQKHGWHRVFKGGGQVIGLAKGGGYVLDQEGT